MKKTFRTQYEEVRIFSTKLLPKQVNRFPKRENNENIGIDYANERGANHDRRIRPMISTLNEAYTERLL